MHTRALVAAALAASVATGGAAMTPPGDPAASVAPASEPVTITLLTGDRVTVAVVSGEWTFRAEPGTETATDGLLGVRYDVAGIGPRGQAPRSTEVAVSAVEGEGASVTGLSWSADAGATWTEAELSDGVAVVDAPADFSVVSLRAEASNAAGETVVETVKGAYLVQ